MIVKKFDVCLMNPPYGDSSNGGMNLDMQFVDKCNEISKINIAVYPGNRFSSFTKIGNRLQGEKHLKEVEFIDGNKVFNINTQGKYCGVYYYDNENTYDTIKTINLDGEECEVGIDYESRKNYYDLMTVGTGILSIKERLTGRLKELKDKYGTMVNDGHGFIYEENRMRRGHKKYGVTKEDQKSLSRVREYLKSGKYKYCLYKGSFNHSYDEMQEWSGQDPDKLFRGQVCWLTNSETVRDNIKYWANSPLFDFWHRMYITKKGVAGCCYGDIPALDFEQDTASFRKYVDSLNDFSTKEIEELVKINVHNTDKLK